MFYGEFAHSLDPKGRIIIPAKLRDICKGYGIEKLFITRGLDRCLFMFTEDEWRRQDQKFKEMPFTKQEARKFNRLYFSGVCEVTIDKQGRFLLPQFLKEYAGIKEQVMIAGVSDRIEIWARERWDDYFQNALGSFEEIAEKLFE